AVLATAVSDVARELGAAVVRVDDPARDLLLLDQRAPVVGVVREGGLLEHGPPRRERDQDREEDREQAEELDDPLVHLRPARPCGAPRSARGRTRSGGARAAPCSPRSSCRRTRRTAA